MRVSFVDAALEPLDTLLADVVLLPYFSDERPLRHVTSLVDWRVLGALSEVVQERAIGLLGDRVEVPLQPHLPIARGILIGLGLSAAFTAERQSTVCRTLFDGVDAARIACALPGASMGIAAPAAMLSELLPATPSTCTALTVIETQTVHRQLRSTLEQYERRQRVDL